MPIMCFIFRPIQLAIPSVFHPINLSAPKLESNWAGPSGSSQSLLGKCYQEAWAQWVQLNRLGRAFISTDGALQRKGKKLYNIADVGKDFHFTNGFLPGCRSVVRGLSFAYLSKKLERSSNWNDPLFQFHVERVYSIIRYLTNYRTENSQAKTEKGDQINRYRNLFHNVFQWK